MDAIAFLRLLDDKRVVDEIERYKWIESEKIGRDIGRERAALEWIRAYGHIWLKIHKSQEYAKLAGVYHNECGSRNERLVSSPT